MKALVLNVLKRVGELITKLIGSRKALALGLATYLLVRGHIGAWEWLIVVAAYIGGVTVDKALGNKP